ncbi:hypothetical protein AAZX31_06G193100 [Glycine max]|nr:hypothetical protein GLYMA_06G203150v4 [Glycine max]KAH1126830.1 hypothetical protein GYH30_015699 [Glycine max]
MLARSLPLSILALSVPLSPSQPPSCTTPSSLSSYREQKIERNCILTKQEKKIYYSKIV